MAVNDHPIFDKRQKKPLVYRVVEENNDITIQNIEFYKVGKAEIRFKSPNITSIFLSVSDKELTKAKDIYNILIRPKESVREKFELTDIDTVKLYDYLEHIQTSIITLYSGIESLANGLIPDGFEFEENNSKGIKEIWNKIAIERWKQTKDKLKEIIPQALKIPSPSSYKCWTRFLQFEQLRNDIIHIKSTSVINKEEEKKIIGLLINDSVFNKINSAKDLIKELSKAIPNHYEYPILATTEALIPIVIQKWDDLGMTRVI
jgi:hypothetical protein